MSKIFLFSDSPYASTGLGRMSDYFLRMFPEHEWLVWGQHHPKFLVDKGSYKTVFDQTDYEAKFQVISPVAVTGDMYGFDAAIKYIEHFEPDYVLTSMDLDRALNLKDGLKELQFTQDIKWINYFPMDREDYKELEVQALRYPDINVTITKFGQQKIQSINPKIDIKQIWHPIDYKEFPKVDTAGYREKAFGIPETDFLIGSVNRSFARKDTGRLVVALSKFIRENPDAYAYIHGNKTTYEGLDLESLAMQWQMPEKRLAFMPEKISEIAGVPQDAMNKIYQTMDCFLTVSSGEGFGFTTVEAMLAELPVIAPNNTSFPELVQDYGILLEPSEYAFHYNGHDSMWPVVPVESAIHALQEVKDNYEMYKDKAKQGRKWVKKNLNLNVIREQWAEILV